MHSNAPNPDHRIRADIQALRGFAVLVVLFYHGDIGFIRSGFLGVDVFFVISGFLITGLIRNGIQNGTFNLWAFYVRRAKRLLPAAFATFLGAALLAPLFLASNEMRDFQRQLVGALTFTANFSLLRQSGYFEGAAELKPLLHIWSLAIEEQYYFLLPITLWCLPRRLWAVTTFGVILASLGLCWWLVRVNPAEAFYLLPTRAWELGIGSLGALLITTNSSSQRWLQFSFWPAVVSLIVLPFTPQFGHHPGLNALAICVATIVIILRKHPIFNASGMVTAMGKIGDISYSLYLVHWPLFAFLNNSWLGQAGSERPPLEWRASLLLLSFLLAVLLNRTIEKPLRFTAASKPIKVFAGSIAASLAVLAVSTGISRATAPTADYAAMRRSNQGLSEKCEFTTEFRPIAECRTSETPDIIIWGDSYAMHLVAGIASQDQAVGIVQATRSACGPLLGIAPVRRDADSGYDVSWGRDCIAFNDSVMTYLKDSSVKTIVLSSLLSQYLDAVRYQLLERRIDSDAYVLTAPQEQLVAGKIEATIKTLRAAGKKVVMIAPPPQSGLDIGRCVERLHRRLPMIGPTEECRIDQMAYKQARKPVLDLLDSISARGTVDIIRFDPVLCHSGGCDTVAKDTAIYRDAGHFSIKGSAWIAEKMQLLNEIKKHAR
ncbi:MAG TPA: acyltransferase family protein [Pararhizobium sp.]|uniref:acyltransferase family protein n=1 Tax=Pararhizobium sp. TaxID=1977563 RepID=UPI002C510865|nr:acyltransferase family protein [Pararhizobium sp.]HTO29587.1 acyltransferase family protein [Pararhizobium sp.]